MRKFKRYKNRQLHDIEAGIDVSITEVLHWAMQGPIRVIGTDGLDYTAHYIDKAFKRVNFTNDDKANMLAYYGYLMRAPEHRRSVIIWHEDKET